MSLDPEVPGLRETILVETETLTWNDSKKLLNIKLLPDLIVIQGGSAHQIVIPGHYDPEEPKVTKKKCYNYHLIVIQIVIQGSNTGHYKVIQVPDRYTGLF